MTTEDGWAPDAEDLELTERAREDRERRMALFRAGGGTPVARPEKYGDPIGMDHDGNPFPLDDPT